MKKTAIITPAQASFAFRLAGLNQIQCETGELFELVVRLVESDEYIFIVIDERLLDIESETKLVEIKERWSGAIVILPPPAGGVLLEEDYVSRIVRKAIGYHVRLTV